MKKILSIILIIITNIFCSEKIVNSIKVADAKNCDWTKDPSCKACPQWSFATLDNKGKGICIQCPKGTTITTVLKNGEAKCSECPKGTILKEYKPTQGITPPPGILKYSCGCKDDKTFAKTQPNGSIKCNPASKNGSSFQQYDFKADKTGNKKIIFTGDMF